MSLIQTVMTLIQTIDYLKKNSCMRRSSFFSEGSNSDNFVFIVDEEREDPNTIKSVSSLARQRSAIYIASKTPFRWTNDGWTSRMLAWKFCDIQG